MFATDDCFGGGGHSQSPHSPVSILMNVVLGEKKNQRKFSNSTVFKAQLIDYNRAINVKYRRSPNLTQGYFHDGLV